MSYPRGRKPDLLERAFRFARWAAALPKPPTRDEVQGYLQCTGPMAARWRRTWLASLPDKKTPARSTSVTGGNRTRAFDTQEENEL